MVTWGRLRFGRSAPVATTADLADRLHPYLVPAEYPDVLSTPTQPQRTVGHGLSVALVLPSDPTETGVLAAVAAGQLATAGLTLAEAYARAERNLLRALSEQRIKLRTIEPGSGGYPLVVAGGHWLAATVMLAPGLVERLAPFLGEDVIVAVPNRSSLVVFPAAARAAVQTMVEEDHRNATKPLTSGLFSLTSDGPEPIA